MPAGAFQPEIDCVGRKRTLSQQRCAVCDGVDATSRQKLSCREQKFRFAVTAGFGPTNLRRQPYHDLNGERPVGSPPAGLAAGHHIALDTAACVSFIMPIPEL